MVEYVNNNKKYAKPCNLVLRSIYRIIIVLFKYHAKQNKSIIACRFRLPSLLPTVALDTLKPPLLNVLEVCDDCNY